MIYLDATSAAASPLNMGVQRTVRGVYRELAARYGGGVKALRWDFSRRCYASLSRREQDFLERPFEAYGAAQAVPGRWGWAGWWEAWKDRRGRRERALDLSSILKEDDVLFIPDLCWDRRVDSWKALSGLPGKKIAVFHDAMPLNIPGQSGSNDALFREYVRALGVLDQVICISREVRDDLLRYWEEFDVEAKPVPLLTWPVPFPGKRPDNPPNRASRHLIYVARLKLRKNHLVLLEACEKLWRRGVDFSLDLIGVEDALPDTLKIMKRVRKLAREGWRVRWRKHISEADLDLAYRDCAFTVFPSKMEGFGLPVIESLWHRRPVICGRNGAIGEVAAEGGGCLQIDQNNPDELAGAMERLLEQDGVYRQLYDGAGERKFRTWAEYGEELEAVLGGKPGVP